MMNCLEMSEEAVIILFAFLLRQMPDNPKEKGFLLFIGLESFIYCHKETMVAQSISHHGVQEAERKDACALATF